MLYNLHIKRLNSKIRILQPQVTAECINANSLFIIYIKEAHVACATSSSGVNSLSLDARSVNNPNTLAIVNTL